MSTVPYYPQDFSSGEPEQFRCLGTKTNFAVVHGFGRIIFQSFPILESQGTNLILEVCNRLSIPHCSSLINLVLFLFLSSQCIYRTMDIYLEAKNQKSIDSFYIQMDNTNSNKSIDLLSGLAALILLKVARKVKVLYRHII